MEIQSYGGGESQTAPDEIYVQDVVTHPERRGRGVARALLSTVSGYGTQHGCTRMYLTSEPDNIVAHRTWLSLGFVNLRGDRVENGIGVVVDFKGPGRDRAVYELDLRRVRPDVAPAAGRQDQPPAIGPPGGSAGTVVRGES